MCRIMPAGCAVELEEVEQQTQEIRDFWFSGIPFGRWPEQVRRQPAPRRQPHDGSGTGVALEGSA